MSFEHQNPSTNNNPLSIVWQALVVLCPENGQLLTPCQLETLAASTASDNTIHHLAINPDQLTDNILCTFELREPDVTDMHGIILQSVEAIRDGIDKVNFCLGFVAMQLAQSTEIPIDTIALSADSGHDVSIEANELFQQLREFSDALEGL